MRFKLQLLNNLKTLLIQLLSLTTGVRLFLSPLPKTIIGYLVTFIVLTLHTYLHLVIGEPDGKGTYNLTLFGQLGKVFGEMQKITFDTSSSDTDYIIDGSEYVNEYITKDLVYSSWTSNGQTTDELIVKGDEGYHVTDIIGFAPNNSFSDNFEYGTYQINSGESEEFTDTLERLTDTLEENDDYFSKVTGISASTAIPDGLLPREIGEYRKEREYPNYDK